MCRVDGCDAGFGNQRERNRRSGVPHGRNHGERDLCATRFLRLHDYHATVHQLVVDQFVQRWRVRADLQHAGRAVRATAGFHHAKRHAAAAERAGFPARRAEHLQREFQRLVLVWDGWHHPRRRVDVDRAGQERDPGLVLPAARNHERFTRLDSIRPNAREGEGARLQGHRDPHGSVGRLRPDHDPRLRLQERRVVPDGVQGARSGGDGFVPRLGAGSRRALRQRSDHPRVAACQRARGQHIQGCRLLDRAGVDGERITEGVCQ